MIGLDYLMEGKGVKLKKQKVLQEERPHYETSGNPDYWFEIIRYTYSALINVKCMYVCVWLNYVKSLSYRLKWSNISTFTAFSLTSMYTHR